MDDDDLAWVAGFLEGEGTFWKQTSRRGYVRVGVRASSTDEDVLRYLGRLIPEGRIRGPLKPHASTFGKKPFWTWDLGVRGEVLELLQRIRPWMGKRRTEQIDALFEHHASRPALRAGRIFHPEHGTRIRFDQGCRCDECRAAQNTYQRTGRRLRAERGANAGVNDDLILRCVASRPGSTVCQIAEAARLHETDVRADLKRMESVGRVRRHRTGMTGTWFWEAVPGDG